MDLEDTFLKALYAQQKPHTYTQVAQLFELNYQRILTLIPWLKTITDNQVIQHKTAHDLYLLVEQRTPYTGTFILTHQLPCADGYINRPDIKFKVYFDAQLLEVLSVCRQTTLNTQHPYLAQCADMTIQWELNTFLERWLDYCLNTYQGKLWQTASKQIQKIN